MKKWCSIDQQIACLKEKKLAIEDDVEFIRNTLKIINYYRLMGYAFPFKTTLNHMDNYHNIPFKEIILLHEKDSYLRNLFSNKIEKVELCLRTLFAYNLGSISPNIHNEQKYWNLKYYETFQANQEKNMKNKNNLAVKHHKNKIKNMPIWVIIEYINFGTLQHILSV